MNTGAKIILDELINQHGFSFEEIAKHTGISKRTLQRTYLKQVIPSMKTVRHIMQFYCCFAYSILSGGNMP